MARLLARSNRGELRDNVEVLEFEAEGDDLFSQVGEIVFIGSPDLFGHAMGA